MITEARNRYPQYLIRFVRPVPTTVYVRVTVANLATLPANYVQTVQRARSRMSKWPERLAAPVLAADNDAIAFWQSRHNLRCAPQLTDIRALARAIRGVK